jgi:hypothetical protein
MVGHVMPVAILMIVQAVLEIAFGLMLAVFAVVMPALVQQAIRQQQAQGGPAPMPGFPGGVGQLALLYGAMATAVFIPGVVRLIAGIRSLRFRGRGFGIVSLFLGLLSIGSCYCAPTSIGLMIYGLIVYFNSDAAYAFTLGERGVPSGEILARYYRDPQDFRFGDSVERERFDEYEAGREADQPRRTEKSDQFYRADPDDRP